MDPDQTAPTGEADLGPYMTCRDTKIHLNGLTLKTFAPVHVLKRTVS